MKPEKTIRKKLLLVNFSQEWGGGENWFWMVAQALVERGYEIQLMVRPDSALAQKAEKSGIPCIYFHATTLSLLNFMKIRRLRQLFRQFRPDVVMLNASHELKFVGLIAARSGVPHIVFRRGLSFPPKNNFLNRWYFRNVVSGFLTNSHETYEKFRTSFPPIASYPHLVIHNGIPLEKWPLPDGPREPFLIGLSSRLSPEKGIDRAIEIMEMLKKTGFPARLHVLGEGPQRPELELMIQEKGLSETVHLLGFVDDVRAELGKCQVFLFTSWGEGTSIAVIEAMAAGLPCVAYEAPSMKELILPGKTGYLVEANHKTEMAAHIRELLENEALRQEMSKQARSHMENHFSFARVTDQLTNWLDDL